MTLKICIRFNGLVIKSFELEPGDYRIGRDSDNEINISHSSIRRHHGRLTHGSSGWVYIDLLENNSESLNDQAPILLSSVIDMTTERFATEEPPQAPFHHGADRNKRERIIYAFIGVVALILGCFLTYTALRSQMRHSDPNQLLAQVRDKIVEFEKIKDPQAIEDYKKYGQFKDEDFRDNIGFCTGFLVAPNVIMTASHCLWGSDFLDIHTNFEVRTSDGKKFSPKRILGFDPVRDFLFLETEGLESYGHLSFTDTYKVGQTVYTLGNAHGQGIAIREGIMASETVDVNDPTIRYIRYSAGASPGNSGGPLLDTDGNIVALVFAATGAENYNLGTSAKDLKIGYDKYVKNTAPKTINVVLRRLFNFNAHQFLQKQILPFLQDYNDHPDIIQKVNDLQLTFTVPMPFAEVSQQVVSEVDGKSTQVLSEVEEAMRAKKELVLDWTSFVSETTPAIHASQFDLSQNSFYLGTKRYYMKLTGFLDSPNRKDFNGFVDQFEKEKKFDFQAYGMNIELRPPTKEEPKLVYMPRDKAKSKQLIEDLTQGALYAQMLFDRKLDDKDLVQTFLKNYLGIDGVLASTYSAFIRPQSYKNFNIESIDKETDEENVEDGSGRQWRRFHFKIFDQVHFYIYCMPLPEALACVARVVPIENDVRREKAEANFRQHILSVFLENPFFWKPKALVDFIASPQNKGLTSLSGVKLRESGGAYQLTLDAFKMEMRLPADMQSLRIQTGLFMGKNQKIEWTGYGAEWVTSAPAQVCGMGVEPLGSQSVFILNFLRDSLKRLKLKDDDKKEEIPKLWTEKVITANGDEVQVHGYCAALRENPMEIGYFFSDFKRAKPRPAVYKMLK